MSSELVALWELPAARAAAILLWALVVAKVLEKVSYCDVVDGEKEPEAGAVVTFDSK